MKFLAFLTMATLSYSAFSQTCYVDMVNRYNQVVRSYTAYDAQNSCMEGMKQCRKAIRLEPQLGGVDCIRATDQVPNPIPQPTPFPIPQPNPSEPYPTNIFPGERVFNVSNSRYAVIVAQDFQGKFVIRYTDNNLTGSGWSRQDLAPLRGCDFDVCVNDVVFNTSNSRFATVVGLQLIGKFVLKYNDNGLSSSGWSRNDIAITKGCDMELCVGDQVLNVSNNRFARVAALQVGTKYVLTYKDNNLTGSGWSRQDLGIMQGCQSGLCVGSRVINITNNRYAVIAALQTGNRFVLRYDDNGLTGSGWGLRDLAPLR